MRTTLNIEDDVLDRAKSLAARKKLPIRQIINEALRKGLTAAEGPARTRPYRTQPHKMGVKPGRNLDNIQELLSQIEGEDRR